MADEAPREILVIHVTRIGDTLLATPALRAIAAAYPAARITCLAHPKRAEILRHLPFLAHVGSISKRRAPFLGRLGGRRYDLAFVFGYDRPLVAYALRVARRVVAFRQGDPRLDGRLDPCVEPPAPGSRHAAAALLALPEAVGIPPAGLRLAYRVSEDESAWARTFLSRCTPPEAAPLIGLQVASFPTKAWRDWPLEHFSALCRNILSGYPRAHFLIFGGTAEQARTQSLCAQLGSHGTLLAGRLSLRQTAALMSRIDLYVGVDTGPTHIMGCFDIPLVGLYHCQSPSRVFGALEHPCLHAVDHPRRDGDCSSATPMAEISVARVWQEVRAALAPTDRIE
ncbi:MAG: glycosyltransferase family 9 protein [Rhodocyclaceae bacterium]|nr:glycosyltransferase family 9 protein [Rhodocyclaceae bacterium]